MNATITLLGCLAIPMVVGFTSGAITAPEIKGWYNTTIKPSFNPPNYVFAPVWTTLYLLMGVSLFWVVRQSEGEQLRIATTIFAVQLLLNFCWSILFFKLH